MKSLTLIILFIINCYITYAQIDRKFWFAIPKETDHSSTSLTPANNVSFKISAMYLDARVTISMPANPEFTTRSFVVPAGQSRTEVMASTYAQFAAIYNNNAPLGSSPVTGQTNRGILITADNDITVYYDYDNTFNRDIFSLKGKNALGTEFYTPFQNIWYNDTATYNPAPYSTIEIVATEDNTAITITPRPGQRIEGKTNDAAWTIILNRGQAYSVRAKYAAGRAHLTGLHITSTNKIAVVINDDSVRQNGVSCKDINGDQLVPTNIIGSQYVVMTGDRSNTTTGITYPYHYPSDVGEQIFVTAADAGTVITFTGSDETILYQTPPLAAGQSDYFSVDINNPSMSSIYVSATDLSKRFYTYHITGIGCELGGAILPPIANCTGSSEVSFYRSNTIADITLNLMVPYNTGLTFNDASQPHNFFTLITYNSDGSIASSVPIPGESFEPNLPSKWAVLKKDARNFNTITSQGKTYKIVNTKDFFHLGMTNGTTGQTGKYGYFSSFSAAQPDVRVSQSNAADVISCFGDSVTFVASGGLSYTWHYGTPSGSPTYLSNANSAMPKVINAPAGSHNFYVEITNLKCFETKILKVNYTVLPIVKADFEFDKSTKCAPDSIVITNKSIEADIYTWKIQKGSGPEERYVPTNTSKFKVPSENFTTVPIEYTFKLIAASYAGCTDQITKTITVNPRAQPVFETDKATVCSPDSIVFTNKTTHATSCTWQKQIGLGPVSTLNFTLPHNAMKFTEPFINPSNTASLNIKYNLIAENSYGCIDTTSKTIVVHPKVTADFSANTLEGCSPLNVSFTNNSTGAGLSYAWAFSDGTTFNASNISHTFINNGSVDKVYFVKLIAWPQSFCADTATQNITVYPELRADFSASDTVGYNPLNITFTNNTSDNNATFSWIFGDGNNSIAISPSQEFVNNCSSPLKYEVFLYVTNAMNCKDTASKTILVKPTATALSHQINNSERITLYPIPAGNEATIEYTLEHPANVTIELFSADGKLMDSRSEYKFSGKNKDILELAGIKGKTFLVKLRYNDKVQTIKGIKE